MHHHANAALLDSIAKLQTTPVLNQSSYLSSGLVRHWTFKKKAVVDRIASANAVWVGNEGWSYDPYIRQHVPLTRGSAGYLSFNASGLPTGASPVSLAIYARSYDGSLFGGMSYGTAAGGQMLGLHTYSDGFVKADYYSGTLTSTGVTHHSGWVHMAATYDGATLKLYGGGLLLGSAAVTLNLGTTEGIIGSSRCSAGIAGQGLVADCRIYNRCLSAAEVLSIARAEA